MTTSFTRFAIPLVAPLLVALVIPACGDEQLEAVVKALGEGCLIDSDCEGELVCVFRRCHHECETDKDCVSLNVGPYCRLGDRPTHVCLLGDEQSCETHADCPTGAMVCSVDDICRDACSDASECLPDQSCLKGSCGNVIEEGLDEEHPLLNDAKGGESEPCIYNSQCLSPLACIQGLCRVECIDDRDCASDSRCVVIPDGDIPDTKACVAEQAPTTPTGPGPAHCSDGAVSGDESAVDCGGSCTLCPSGGACGGPEDCVSGVCTGGTCQAATCSDGVRNGTELGIDCGGACPAGCPTGTQCTTSDDCTSPDTCDQGICVAPECGDGLLNNLESDVDCGGPNCSPCDPLKDCVTAGDCASLVCAAGTCLPAGCSDGVTNGSEADVDCGGPASGCALCGNGATCTQSDECASGSCSGTCVAPSCNDGVQNGTELGVDCGGPACSAGCPLGTACNVDDDCDQTAPAGCHPSNLTCTARHSVTVSLAGSGSGTVTSTPAGIACGTDCDTVVFDGASLQLDGAVGVNSTFAGFDGVCAGSNPCLLSVTADTTVTATFDAGGPSSANWHVDPASGNIYGAAYDSGGHLVAGASGPAGSQDWGCGLFTGSGDFTVAKYLPGPAAKADACVAYFIDGGPGTQDFVDVAVDANDDIVVLLTASTGYTLAGQPVKSCTGGSGFGLAWYDGSLTQTASQVTDCYGPATPMRMGQLSNGNLVVAGQLTGTSTDLGGAPLSYFNGRFFLAVYDGLTGNLLAQHQFGDSFDYLEDVAVDPVADEIVVTMGCYASVDFGNGVMSVDAGNGSTDICAAKFNAALQAQWAFQVGSASNSERGTASAFLPNGDVVVTGYFSTLIHFGDGLFVPSAGQTDIAVIHVDGVTGTLKSTVPNSSWRAYGTPSNDQPAAIGVVPSGPLAGTIYLAGATTDAGGIDVGGGLLTAGDGLFLAKYPTFGSHGWSTSTAAIFSQGWDHIERVVSAPDGSPVLVGFASVVTGTDWGSGSITSPYLARFNP